jgi:hypothetical protein
LLKLKQRFCRKAAYLLIPFKIGEIQYFWRKAVYLEVSEGNALTGESKLDQEWADRRLAKKVRISYRHGIRHALNGPVNIAPNFLRTSTVLRKNFASRFEHSG